MKYNGRICGKLWVTHLTPEQHARTCGYWYTVTSEHCPHTAFRSRSHLDTWLMERGLTLEHNITESGQSSRVIGEYRANLSMSSQDELDKLDGYRTRGLQNGEYVDVVITTDADGIRTEHKLNPNIRDRRTYDYAESREMVG